MIYFDWNSTTPLHINVQNAISNILFDNDPLNPSSMHNSGRRARSIIDEARNSILKSLGDVNNEYNLIFTSSGTESNNQIIYSFAKKQIYTSNIEHDSILSIKSPNIFYIDCDKNGIMQHNLIYETLKRFKPNEGFLVSIMHSNNETGIIQNIPQIAQIVHEMRGFLHSDLSQSVGKVSINLHDLDIDYATISSHKIGGPVGASALIYRKNLKLESMILGGRQEFGLRAGTENVIAIKGFSCAFTAIEDTIKLQSYIENLRNMIEDNINSNLGSIILSQNLNRLPNTTMITMYGVSNISQIVFFDMNNIAVSNGSACNSGHSSPSKTLTAMGIDPKIISQTIRISLGHSNTLDEVSYFLQKWHEMATTNQIKN